MNKETKALFILLRAGLWERDVEDLSPFPLTGESWNTVFLLARQQTVTGIAYRGLCHLPDELFPPQPLLLKWVVAVDAIERRNHKMNAELASLYGRLSQNGLKPLLQKGQGVAAFYEKPEVRECGDIDLCFSSQKESQQAARDILGQRKSVRRAADNSFCYMWNGIEVEHHSTLVYIANPMMQRYLRHLERHNPPRSLRLADGGADIPVPSPLLNLLMLNTHIMKHTFGWGIGLRQLCDMARACHALRGEVQADEMKAACQKLGIVRWTRLLHTFLVDSLGLPAGSLPYADAPLSPSPLLAIVLDGGNFGQYQVGRTQGAQAVWRRKVGTSRSFFQRIGFSCSYAPVEAFWTFTSLLKGQFRC